MSGDSRNSPIDSVIQLCASSILSTGAHSIVPEQGMVSGTKAKEQ